jgi:hypothetical protein
MLSRLAGALMALALCAAFGVPAALCSTVIVPDDSSTVQSAIASGVDTVLVREGDFAETPLLERNVVLQGIGVDRRPRLNELRLTNLNASRIVVSGFDVAGNVGYTQVANKSPIGVSISDCSMNVIQLNAYNDNCGLSLVRCRLAFASSGDRYSGLGVGSIAMDADTVGGGVSWIVWSMYSVSIQHCWFMGVLPGASTGSAIELLYEPDGRVSHNRIENYGIGISAPDAEGALTLEGNTIAGCGTGVQLSGNEGFLLKGNVIRNCGTGVSIGGDIGLIGNTITGTSGAGVLAAVVGSFNAGGNVIGNCGGAGFHVDWDPWAYGGLLRSNTVFNCAGSALELSWAPAVPYDSVSVESNVGFGSGTWGLSISGTQFRHGCNDLYGNHAGSVNGIAPDATDLNVDPMFCDVSNADVRLNSSSPLLADSSTCGQIGALGVGCGETPTLVQRFTAGRASGGVRVVWQVAQGATASAIWVERAEELNGQAWTQPVMERTIEGAYVVELDRSALPDHTYRYRLVARDGGKLAVLDPGIVVEAQAPLAFALGAVGPSPGGGPVRVAFTLVHDAAIQIEVFDLLGRKVATPAQGVWPAGMQVVNWDGRTRDGQAAAAGMYVVRYSYPGGQDQRRIARFR